MSTIDIAYNTAKLAHQGQLYDSKDYFEHHVLSVVSILMENNESDNVVVAGYLHDVVEDSGITLHDLSYNLNFNDEVVDAVDCLTRREYETYFDAIRRAKVNPIARIVKLADNQVNLGTSLLNNDKSRINRYFKARAILLGK